MTRPTCGKCGLEMTPGNARIHPELFLHDACLPESLMTSPAKKDARWFFSYAYRYRGRSCHVFDEDMHLGSTFTDEHPVTVVERWNARERQQHKESGLPYRTHLLLAYQLVADGEQVPDGAHDGEL